jgi:hypothetical protein
MRFIFEGYCYTDLHNRFVRGSQLLLSTCTYSICISARCAKGLFGLGDIPKWLGIATEKVVATCLV